MSLVLLCIDPTHLLVAMLFFTVFWITAVTPSTFTDIVMLRSFIFDLPTHYSSCTCRSICLQAGMVTMVSDKPPVAGSHNFFGRLFFWSANGFHKVEDTFQVQHENKNQVAKIGSAVPVYWKLSYGWMIRSLIQVYNSAFKDFHLQTDQCSQGHVWSTKMLR